MTVALSWDPRSLTCARRYSMAQDVAGAVGSLAGALASIVGASGAGGAVPMFGSRALMLGAAGLLWLNVGFYYSMSPVLDRDAANVRVMSAALRVCACVCVCVCVCMCVCVCCACAGDCLIPAQVLVVSAASRAKLVKLCALFALDSLGSGFINSAMYALYFKEVYHIENWVIALLFFLAKGLNAVSHLAAAAIAKRIGLINTMVFTHMPSSLLLLTLAFTPSFGWAVFFFLAREGLVEMDVPVCVCVCACVRACVRVCASVCKCVCVRLRASVCAGVFVYARTVRPGFSTECVSVHRRGSRMFLLSSRRKSAR